MNASVVVFEAALIRLLHQVRHSKARIWRIHILEISVSDIEKCLMAYFDEPLGWTVVSRTDTNQQASGEYEG